MDELPDELQKKVDYLTNLQKNYCRYRAKGLVMRICAKRAGSSAKAHDSLTRVGYQIEQMDGVKEYIEYLRGQRANTDSIDSNDLVTLVKEVYDVAMKDMNLREANKAVETLAKCMGLFDKKQKVVEDISKDNKEPKPSSAFCEDLDEEDLSVQQKTNQQGEKLQQLQQMLRDINNNNLKK